MKVFFKFFACCAFVVFTTNCKKSDDPCDDSVCGPNETCVEGICRCPENYTGVGCRDQITPSKMTIHTIKILRYPTRDPNNNYWDGDQKPDLFITLQQDTEKVWEIDASIQNADQPTYLITPSQPITLSNLGPDFSGEYPNFTFSMFDDDGNQIDQFMAGVVTKIYQDRNGFPSTIKMDTGGIVAYEIEVSYN